MFTQVDVGSQPATPVGQTSPSLCAGGTVETHCPAAADSTCVPMVAPTVLVPMVGTLREGSPTPSAGDVERTSVEVPVLQRPPYG